MLSANFSMINKSQIIKTYRLTSTEADSNVTLEPDVITARELESVEARHKSLSLMVLFPLPKYRRISSAAIFIRDNILILLIVLHSLRDAVSREPAVDRRRLYFNRQHKIVPNFSGLNLAAMLSDNFHKTSRRRPSISNSSSSSKHGDVEA